MKLPILFLCLMSIAMPAMADEKLVERKTCDQIKSEIATLTAVSTPTDEQKSELDQLRMMQRANCIASGGGRRAIARNIPTASTSAQLAGDDRKVLDDYLAAKQANCNKLNAEAEKVAKDESKAELAAELRRYYNMDCIATQKPIGEPQVPEKTEEEWAAEFDANLAAGLCGDGTKPNRYGCCTDETFKDLGNTVFACCPKSGGICFPPMK